MVDQIAAGEVVERPSHMVKELIENSLDAGATEVEVQYAEGGRHVKVIDNGVGIAADDLSVALARHGTSKIQDSEDLWNLHSFGFRGEALASIAAVSELSLTSRPQAQNSAYKISASFGKVQTVEMSGGGFGTQVSIQNLFENIPARLKFLKSAAAESTQIKNMFKALAMAHPQVQFRLEENGQLLFYFRASSALERVSEVLGVKLYQGYAQRDHIKVTGFFTDPHTVQKTSKNIWLFAQNRWIQDRGLNVAVIESYRSLLMHGEYPSAAVFIECDPNFIDVNIHPTKSQVKFHDPSAVFRCVQSSLRQQLEQAPWRGVNELSSLPRDFHKIKETEVVPESFKFSDPSLITTNYKQKDFNLIAAKQEAVQREGLFTSHEANQAYGEGPSFSEQSSPFTPVTVSDNPCARTESERNKLETPAAYWSLLQVLGQADLTYIVCQNERGLVFVDQHAAHERVVFEKLMRSWTEKKTEVQDLLIPLILDFAPEKVEALLRETVHLQKLGIEIEAFGPQSIAVKTLPPLIKEGSLAKALEKMADEIFDHGGSFKIENMIIDLCATMACHSVVRAGQSMSKDQMKSLLVQMDEFPMSSFCPHGRPVSVEYPFQKLEKDFGRIV